jgi:hypothetical protein
VVRSPAFVNWTPASLAPVRSSATRIVFTSRGHFRQSMKLRVPPARFRP